MIETLIISGLTQVIKNLVISEATDLTSDLVKKAVNAELDDEQKQLLKGIIEKAGTKL
jgi:division protein CdvB (Snf7/Vps24/ESCRT-III family)|tara:strand:+ start:529 stop:702 length:174 start_codon:yes stop_codon:yes gene_type:complete